MHEQEAERGAGRGERENTEREERENTEREEREQRQNRERGEIREREREEKNDERRFLPSSHIFQYKHVPDALAFLRLLKGK